MNKDSKSIILFHRSYRKLPGSFLGFLLQFILFTLPFSIITFFYYPQFTTFICQIAEYVLEPYFTPDTVRIIGVEYIDFIGNISSISFLDLPGMVPAFTFSLMNALVCLVVLIILPRIDKAKPLIIFLIIVASIHMVSSLFFLFFPTSFPYVASDYSRLYMLQHVSIWFFVPIIMGLAIMPLPSSIPIKIFTMIITYINALVFGTIRYVVFLFILAKVSMIYMAILFFVLGPLIDFVYIVGIYSLHVNRLANKIKGDFNLWKWQYS